MKLKKHIFCSILLLSIVCVFPINQTFGQTVSTAKFKSEVRDFLAKEVAVHFGEIKTFDPPPAKVNGSITTGQFYAGRGGSK
jgi:hypothetical protein